MVFCLSSLALILLVVPASAESFSASMQVSATVVARARVTVESQPAEIVVTAADIARGFVDVPAPVVWKAQTNSRRGYLLQVSTSSEIFPTVDLTFGATEMHVAGESWVQRPYVSGGERLTVKARLILSSVAVPGTYALPITISATPL